MTQTRWDGKADLTGQVAIVTGGGRGLGRAFALALAKAGAAVAITARTHSEVHETAGLINANGGKALAFTADVTDVGATAHIVAEVSQKLGPVDLLVNNAAMVSALGHEWEVDAEEWWQVMTTNLKGPYIWTRAVLPEMMARRHGRIVNVSSIAAYGDYSYMTAYGASKAALTNFSHNLHLAVNKTGITVFAFAPGGWTGMQQKVIATRGVPAEVRNRFKGFEAQGDANADKSVEMLMLLVSGRLDALTGRHISFRDSGEQLIARTDEIVRQDLLTLRRRELE